MHCSHSIFFKFMSQIALTISYIAIKINLVQFQVNIGEICVIDFAEKDWHVLIEHSMI